MNHDPQDAAAQAERRRLRATLADLKRLKQRRRPPPAAAPPAGGSPFKFVPASFIADIDWDAADRAPGPDQRAASPAPPPAPPEPEYDGVLEKMDFFLTEFDWQDDADGAATAADAGGDRQAAGDSLGWEEASASASGSPPPPAEPTEAAAPPPTTDGIFTSFQWE